MSGAVTAMSTVVEARSAVTRRFGSTSVKMFVIAESTTSARMAEVRIDAPGSRSLSAWIRSRSTVMEPADTSIETVPSAFVSGSASAACTTAAVFTFAVAVTVGVPTSRAAVRTFSPRIPSRSGPVAAETSMSAAISGAIPLTAAVSRELICATSGLVSTASAEAMS